MMDVPERLRWLAVRVLLLGLSVWVVVASVGAVADWVAG